MPSKIQEIQSVLLPERLTEFFKSPLTPFVTALILQNKTYAKYATAEVRIMKNKKCLILSFYFKRFELTCRPLYFRASTYFYVNRHSFPGQVQRLVMQSAILSSNDLVR